MNRLRILLNLLLAVSCFVGAAYLLWNGRFFLPDRWTAGMGTLFTGQSLYLLAGGACALGAFSGAVAVAWMRGTLLMPGGEDVRPHPSYKGRIILRYWFLVIPAFVLVIAAFLLADRVPSTVGATVPQLPAAAIQPLLAATRARPAFLPA